MEQQLNLNNKSNYTPRFIIALAGLLVFCFVAFCVTTQRTEAFDTAVDYFAYGTRAAWTKAILVPITYAGNWQFIVAVTALLIILPQTRKTIGLPMGATALVSVVVYKMLKLSFARPRPDLDLRLIWAGGYSFPSGHSMNGLVCYGVLIFLIRRSCRNKKTANWLTALLTLLILLIGWSRIFCGVHYVTDVIGGFSVGMAVLMVATILIDRFYLKEKR